MPFLKIKKLRISELKWPAQGYSKHKMGSTSLLAPVPLFSFVNSTDLLSMNYVPRHSVICWNVAITKTDTLIMGSWNIAGL